MKTLRQLVLSLSTAILLSGAAFGMPALARDRVSAESAASQSSIGSSGDSTTGTETETEVQNHASDLADHFRSIAQSDIAEKKTQVKAHTEAERQKSCEARKTALTKRMQNAVTHAQNHKAVFDKIYARVKQFHDTKNLNVADYDALVAKADAAQADAAASITALQSLDISVDCTSQTVAQSVSAFQQAVKNTRDSLKTYRSAIVDLINSLKGASSANTQSSTDNQTNQ